MSLYDRIVMSEARRLKLRIRPKAKAKPCPPGFIRPFNNPDAPCVRPKIKVRRRG